MKHKLESRLPGEISITSDTQMTPHHLFYGRKRRRTKEPLEESEKVDLKLNIQKTKAHDIWPRHFMANRWGNDGNSERLHFGELQYHCRW